MLEAIHHDWYMTTFDLEKRTLQFTKDVRDLLKTLPPTKAHAVYIEQLLRSSSALPVFWQFVGVGQASYGVLERLDTLTGRTVDNAGFFAVDDLDEIQDEQLYSRLLGEFPAWLRSAATAGIPV